MATEKRLIDANALGNGIGVYVATNAYLNDTALDVLGKVAKWLDEAPTVDAVEVVLCKNCIANECCSIQIDLGMGGYGYCPKGRKTDG